MVEDRGCPHGIDNMSAVLYIGERTVQDHARIQTQLEDNTDEAVYHPPSEAPFLLMKVVEDLQISFPKRERNDSGYGVEGNWPAESTEASPSGLLSSLKPGLLYISAN